DLRRPEPDQAGDDILDIRIEGQLRRIDRPRPEVVLEVEGVSLPAARSEVAEEPLPEPRAGQLSVHEQEWLASRASLRQPRFDVDAAIVELDLVLADRPAVRRRDLRSGEDLLRCRFGHGMGLGVRDVIGWFTTREG